MENSSNKYGNKKGRFNIVDVLVIFFIILFIFGTFCIFDPFDWFVSAERREVTISYVIELKSVDDDLTSNIRIGDNVINSSTGEPIGKIFAVDVCPAYEWKSIMGMDEMVKVMIGGKRDVYVKIDVNCIYEDGLGYIVGDGQIAVGTLVNIKLQSFTGSGYCISIEERE